MTIISGLPLLVAVLGAIIYLILLKGTRESVAELSRIAWNCGLLVFLFGVATQVIKW